MIVYCILNKINNKRYIGQTRNKLSRRYSGGFWKKPSNEYLKNSIEKYGIINFELSILQECNSLEELDYWETYYIDFYNTSDRLYGYNLTMGGNDHKIYTPALKLHLSSIQKKLIEKNPDIKRKLKQISDDYWNNSENRLKKSIDMKKVCNLPEKRLANSIRQGGKPFNVYNKITGEFIGKWINKNQCRLDLNLPRGKIQLCLKKQRHSVGNYVFCYENEKPIYGEELQKITTKNQKRVRCINTGEIFNKVKDIELKYGIKAQHIPSLIRGVWKHKSGLQFEYITG